MSSQSHKSIKPPEGVRSETKFADLPLSTEGQSAMRDGFGYEYLTPVQAKTFDPITKGTDLVVRAKTGAGKTLSFLLPVVERLKQLAQNDPVIGLCVLVVSPVRELSLQIFNETRKIAEYYSEIKPVCMIGGADWKEDIEALDAAASSAVVLVVTPGRLQTHLNKTDGFADKFSQVLILVLDEVDQLCSPIFLEATQEILHALSLPSSQQHRQCLFYSATMTDVVTTLMRQVGKPDHAYVDLLEDEALTVPDIEQRYTLVPTEFMTWALWQSIASAKKLQGSATKIVAIFMTGRVAAYYAEAYRKVGEGLEVFEIHAQIKKQEKRTEASNQFRAASNGILFTSDISSRGLDYPGVTDVIQHGAPHSKAEYIHRLGRTGRAGNKGRGILILHDFEQSFLPHLNDLPIAEVPWSSEEAIKADLDFKSLDIAKNVKAQAYYSRINHVMRNYEQIDKLDVLQEAKRFAASIGALDENGRPPEITRENAVKMGVADISDDCLNIVEAAAPQPKAKQKERTRAPKGLYAPGSKGEGKSGCTADLAVNESVEKAVG